MNPLVGQAVFSMGLTIFLLALLVLPFLDRGSPEFVADVLALAISGLLTAGIVFHVRRVAILPSRGARVTDQALDNSDNIIADAEQ